MYGLANPHGIQCLGDFTALPLIVLLTLAMHVGCQVVATCQAMGDLKQHGLQPLCHFAGILDDPVTVTCPSLPSRTTSNSTGNDDVGSARIPGAAPPISTTGNSTTDVGNWEVRMPGATPPGCKTGNSTGNGANGNAPIPGATPPNRTAGNSTGGVGR
jgi:hypothetical protein